MRPENKKPVLTDGLRKPGGVKASAAKIDNVRLHRFFVAADQREENFENVRRPHLHIARQRFSIARRIEHGALLIPAGVHIAPVKGHEIDLYYLYVGLMDVSTLRADPAIGGADIDSTLYHEINLVYEWTLSRHFDIRLAGALAIPADGVKDIANTQTCRGGRACQGEDPALTGEIRFRGLF